MLYHLALKSKVAPEILGSSARAPVEHAFVRLHVHWSSCSCAYRSGREHGILQV